MVGERGTGWECGRRRKRLKFGFFVPGSHSCLERSRIEIEKSGCPKHPSAVAARQQGTKSESRGSHTSCRGLLHGGTSCMASTRGDREPSNAGQACLLGRSLVYVPLALAHVASIGRV